MPDITALVRATVLLTLLGFIQPGLAVSVEVAGRSLEIPTPAGFVDGAVLPAEARELADSLTPATTRLLAFFVSVDDAERAKRGEELRWDRYMLAQVDRSSEPHDISPETFFQIRALYTEQQKSLIANSPVDSDTLLLMLAQDAHEGLRIGESAPFGVFSEDEAHISFSALTRHASTKRQPPSTYLVASGTNVVHTANKVLFTYVYTRFESEVDLAWSERTSRDWTRAVIAANPESTALGSVSWQRLLGGALFGAVIASVALIAIALRRRRRSAG